MIKKLFFTAAAVILTTCTAYAQERYIVGMKQSEFSLFSASDNGEMESIGDDMYVTDKENAEKMLESGRAEFIEPDHPITLYDIGEETADPDDTYYSSQVYMKHMKIPELQQKYSGEGVRVAVIDSGVNREHPDLENANIEKGYNYVDNNEDTSDTKNHGTRVAAVIAATPNNGKGIAGVAPKCTIIPLVAMTSSGGYLSNVVEALEDAVDVYDCKVVNLSLGTDQYSKAFERAVNTAASKGVIIIAAAGNDGGTANQNNLNYPAAFKNTISVGAVGENYELTAYTQRNDMIDVSVVYRYGYLPNNAGGYTYGAGTSFAAPVITGMTALVVSKYPELTVSEIRRLIQAASADVCESGKDYSGYGIIMGDEVDKVINYKWKVYISPYIEGETLKIKMLGKKAGDCILIKAIYDNDVFMEYSTEPVTFDSDGLFYTTVEKPENGTLKLFVWDSIEGQQNYSTVK